MDDLSHGQWTQTGFQNRQNRTRHRLLLLMVRVIACQRLQNGYALAQCCSSSLDVVCLSVDLGQLA
jgi:hypothetical protein